MLHLFHDNLKIFKYYFMLIRCEGKKGEEKLIFLHIICPLPFLLFIFNKILILYINLLLKSRSNIWGINLRSEKQIREKIEEIQYTFGDTFDFEVPKEKKIIYKTLKWVLEEIDDLN